MGPLRQVAITAILRQVELLAPTRLSGRRRADNETLNGSVRRTQHHPHPRSQGGSGLARLPRRELQGPPQPGCERRAQHRQTVLPPVHGPAAPATAVRAGRRAPTPPSGAGMCAGMTEGCRQPGQCYQFGRLSCPYLWGPASIFNRDGPLDPERRVMTRAWAACPRSLTAMRWARLAKYAGSGRRRPRTGKPARCPGRAPHLF